MAKTQKDHIELLHDYGIHVQTRTIWLESSYGEGGEEEGVNYVMTMCFLKNLHLLESAGTGEITIILNTLGGSIENGMALYDSIKAAKSHITIKVYGNAMSMGSAILQAADHRVLMPHAQVMFHQGSADAGGNNTYEVVHAAKAEIALGDKINDILWKRIKAKHEADGKHISRNKFDEMNWKGKFMDAETAVAMGLADEIEQPPE